MKLHESTGTLASSASLNVYLLNKSLLKAEAGIKNDCVFVQICLIILSYLYCTPFVSFHTVNTEEHATLQLQTPPVASVFGDRGS